VLNAKINIPLAALGQPMTRTLGCVGFTSRQSLRPKYTCINPRNCSTSLVQQVDWRSVEMKARQHFNEASRKINILAWLDIVCEFRIS